jgi:uncharacterized membrane protein
VHFPIALLLLGSATDAASSPGARHWSILRRRSGCCFGLGWVGGAVAVLTGLLAQSEPAAGRALSPCAQLSISALGWPMLLVYGFLLYRGWLYRSTRAQKARRERGSATTDLLDDVSARLWIAIVAVLGVTLILVTGWYGGVLVYEFGVNVQS